MQFGERQTFALESFLDRRLWGSSCYVVLGGIAEKRRVLRNVFKCLFCNALERGVVVEAKVTGVDDEVSSCLTGELIQGTEVACVVTLVSANSLK